MNLLFWVKSKYSTKEGQVLAYLKKKGSTGATNTELNRIQFRYGASIHNLRKEGHNIVTTQIKHGLYKFTYKGER